MTLFVSVSDLRNNISDYLERVTRGTRLIIRDEKRGKMIAQITKSQTFDKDAYEKAMRKAAGVFTAENHPQWRTKKDVIAWLKKSRSLSDRKF